MGLRDAIQRLAVTNRHYGYRRIAALLGREGWQANHKRVLRLMREDNLLALRVKAFVPQTTDSRHGWRVVPNLARGMIPTGIDQPWVADFTYVHLAREYISTKSSAELKTPRWPASIVSDRRGSSLSPLAAFSGRRHSNIAFEGANLFDMFQTLPLGRECC